MMQHHYFLISALICFATDLNSTAVVVDVCCEACCRQSWEQTHHRWLKLSHSQRVSYKERCHMWVCWLWCTRVCGKPDSRQEHVWVSYHSVKICMSLLVTCVRAEARTWGGPKSRLKTEAQNEVNKNLIHSDVVTIIFTWSKNEVTVTEVWGLRQSECDVLWTEAMRLLWTLNINCDRRSSARGTVVMEWHWKRGRAESELVWENDKADPQLKNETEMANHWSFCGEIWSQKRGGPVVYVSWFWSIRWVCQVLVLFVYFGFVLIYVRVSIWKCEKLKMSKIRFS